MCFYQLLQGEIYDIEDTIKMEMRMLRLNISVKHLLSQLLIVEPYT